MKSFIGLFFLSWLLILPVQAELITDYLSAHRGEEVTVFGELTEEIHQHMIHPAQQGRVIAYFQPDQDYQTVAYFPKGYRPCPGAMAITGQVLEVRGAAKRPGKPSKVDSEHVEYQLLVKRWHCLQPGTPQAWLHALGRDTVSLATKRTLLEKLASQREQAIPALLAHLKDERSFSQGIALPALKGKSPNPPKTCFVDIPVSEMVEEILYHLITPNYHSAWAPAQSRNQPAFFLVRDWERWWQKHRHQRLEEIHRELRPLIDRYWQSGGTVQVLE